MITGQPKERQCQENSAVKGNGKLGRAIMGQAEAQSIQIIIVTTHCRMNRSDGRFAATVFRVGNFDSPRVSFTANLANEARVKGHTREDRQKRRMCMRFT